jgi:hypothetical protein
MAGWGWSGPRLVGSSARDAGVVAMMNAPTAAWFGAFSAAWFRVAPQTVGPRSKPCRVPWGANGCGERPVTTTETLSGRPGAMATGDAVWEGPRGNVAGGCRSRIGGGPGPGPQRSRALPALRPNRQQWHQLRRNLRGGFGLLSPKAPGGSTGATHRAGLPQPQAREDPLAPPPDWIPWPWLRLTAPSPSDPERPLPPLMLPQAPPGATSPIKARVLAPCGTWAARRVHSAGGQRPGLGGLGRGAIPWAPSGLWVAGLILLACTPQALALPSPGAKPGDQAAPNRAPAGLDGGYGHWQSGTRSCNRNLAAAPPGPCQLVQLDQQVEGLLTVRFIAQGPRRTVSTS